MFHTARAYRGMVTSPHHLASQAGLSVLQDGGNAAEAAIAVAACLAVVYPHMTGIGGDSFWLVAEPDGKTWAVDACGAAAGAADLSLYDRAGLCSIPWRGPLAANTVAGAISGWEALLLGAGSSLPLERLLRDAIHHAQDGVAVTRGGAQIAQSKDAELRADPGYCATFRPEGAPLTEGARLRQPALARTLALLAEYGLGDFYRGHVAGQIAADLHRVGSPLSLDDLRRHCAQVQEPLNVGVNGAQLYNMGPPTQGLVSLLILALSDRLKASTLNGFDHVHGLVEATKQAFLHYRDVELGDPAFMPVKAQSVLDQASSLDAMAARIDPKRALPWPSVEEKGDTTWFGVIDRDGRAISAIQSTYFEFGSGIVLPQTGITWQNRGASFQLTKAGWNALRPGRKPFHTLNPALARFDDGRVMVYGTMGGEGQPQTQAAIFSRYARFGVGLQEAITSPRWLLGRTWGEQSVSLKLENRFEPSLYDALRQAGHDVEVLDAYTSTMGHAGALVLHADGLIEGASDPRSDGLVAAW